MSVVLKIRDREAIPVRAIPFVTGWSMSSDMVASSFSQTDLITKLKEIASYHLAGNEEIVPMLPKEWIGVEAKFQTLSARLKDNENADSESYPTWIRELIETLPDGVFVWKDELASAFAKAN